MKRAPRPPKSLLGKVQQRLDEAVDDSFPCSDPVSFLEPVPIKQGDVKLCTVEVNRHLPTDADARSSRIAGQRKRRTRAAGASRRMS
jgi:hypothetical protein